MLKAMRKNVKALAPVLWIVIATFVIAIFAVWGGGGFGEGRAENIIATAGSAKITSDEYYNSLRQRIEALQKEFKELNRSFIQQLNIPQQVLEEMVQQALLLQIARDLGIGASDEELRRKITSYPVFQKDGQFIGFQEYENILKWNHIPLAEFEQNLKKEIILTKLIQVLTAGVTVTPDEVWSNYRRENETAKLDYLVLENSKVTVPDEPAEAELQAYFDKNKDTFKIPEKREAVYVFLRTQDLKKEVEFTEAEIEKYFRDNEDQFKVPEETAVSRIFLSFESTTKELVLAEAQNLAGRIGRGEDFAELARKQSKDAKASQGGDWGLFEWQSLSAPEKDAIGKLEAGQVSPPVEVENGVSLLKVTKKSEASTTPLAEAKPRIRTMLEEQKAQAMAAERIARVEKDAKKDKSLESAAGRSNLKAQRTGLLRKGEALGDIDPSGAISQALFGLEVKGLSSPLYTYQGVGLAQLQTIATPRDAVFEEVREDVKQAYLEVRKKDMALEKMRAVQASMGTQDWEDVATKNGLEFKTINEHKRGQYIGTVGENADVDQLAFSLPLNTVSEPVEFANGYVLLRVKERKEVTAEDFAKNKDSARASLVDKKKNEFLSSYLAWAREEKGVKVRYDVFVKVSQDILSRFAE